MEEMKFEDFEKESKPSETMGIIGFVFSLIGLITSCCYGLGLIFSIPGLILSAIQVKKNKTGLGIAGLVIGIIAVILGLLMIILLVSVINTSEFRDIFNSMMENSQNTI